MPYIKRKKYSSKPSKRRPYRKVVAKTTSTRTQRRRVARGPFHRYVSTDPFPPVKYCKLHYASTYNMSSGTTGLLGTEQVMNLNSLYDPDQSGIGHQPYGHDELALLYKVYKVTAVQFTLVITNPSSDGVVVAARVSPPLGAQSLTGQTGYAAAEQPMTVTRMINNTGSQVRVIKQYFPMAQIIGVTPLQFKAAFNNSYTAAFGANPGFMPTLRFAIGDTTGNAGTTCTIQCNITYYVQCSERAPLSQS